MSDPTPTLDSHSANLVPEKRPAVRSDTPRPVRTIRGLSALPGMILLWFLPRRVGASLAGAGWRAAFVAHVLGITLGSGLIVWAEVFPWTNPVGMAPISYGPSYFSFKMVSPTPKMAFVEYLTAPFAALAIAAHASSGTGGSPVNVVLVVIGGELGVMVAAFALMPFAAAGEPTGRLFGRCLRLTWWSTTMLIPLGIGWLLDPLFRRRFELPNEWMPVDYAALALFAVWWLLVLLRSGYRYAGPATGPAWESRTPCCEGCGYIIAHIPVTTKCPECGRPIAESLAERRRAPAFVIADTFAKAGRLFWATLRQAIFGKTFFDQLAVHRDHARDRTFFLGVSTLTALSASLGVVLVECAVGGEPFSGNTLADLLIVAGICLVGQVALAGLVAMLAAALGRRTVQSSAVVTFYALAGLLPLTCGLLLFVFTLAFMLRASNRWTDDIATVLASILGASMCVASGWLVLAGARCIGRAFPRTRRANA